MKTFISEKDAFELYENNQCVIFDCRNKMDDKNGVSVFEAGHIKNSVYTDQYQYLTGNNPISGGRHPLPDLNAFYHFVKGHAGENAILAFDYKNNFFATRFLFLCHLTGLDCKVIDGGAESFERFKLDDAETHDLQVQTTNDKAPEINRDVIAFHEDVYDIVTQQDSERIIIDARAHERYTGEVEPLDHKKGHIQGAYNVPFTQLFDDGKIKDAETLKQIFSFASGKEIVVSCGSGLSATPLYAALKSIDENVKLYAGSFSEWIDIYPELIETGDKHE